MMIRVKELMKRLLTLGTVLLFVLGMQAQRSWQPTEKSPVAGQSLINDDLLTMTTSFPAFSTMRFIKREPKGTILGNKGRVYQNIIRYGDKIFDFALRIRVTDPPSDSISTGQQYEGSTSLILAPNKNLMLRVYYKRQINKDNDNAESNDKKDLKLVNIANPTEVIKSASFRTKPDNNTHCYAEKVYRIDANNKYVLWSKGTTILLYCVEYSELPISSEQ